MQGRTDAAGPAEGRVEPGARTGGAVERTAAGALVETATLPDGRAIRYFSWAPDTEWASIVIDGAPGGPPAPTRRAGGPVPGRPAGPEPGGRA